MRIAVAGLGYVGLSLACLLARHNEVRAVDISEERVERVNSGVSPIADTLIETYLASSPTKLSATTDATSAYSWAELVIVATPTNYNDTTHSFDTSSIENVLDIVATLNPAPPVVIKSTIPVGYTKIISASYPALTILFSPEFLREGHALDDNLHPTRIIVGTTTEGDRPLAKHFASLLAEGAEDKDVPTRIIGSTEAEAIKLFANTYLALRVSFFNELDTYAEVKGLDSAEVIDGVCLDPRIGAHYNNPSFGYGGYCLPKDTKQLLANYEDVPQNLMRAIVDSNATRKDFIVESILDRHPSRVGVYRLVMKSGSDNFRQSSTLDVIGKLREKGVSILIYEPTLAGANAFGCPLCNNLHELKSSCDLILANRWSDELSDVSQKVYTRDLWRRD